MLHSYKCWFYFIFWPDLSILQEKLEKQFFALLSKTETSHSMPHAVDEDLLVSFFVFVFNWRHFMERDFGLKPWARRASTQGRVPGCPQRRQGTGQGSPDEAELTHRQLLSTPRTTASCLCLSSSPPSPSESWKSLEDFLTTASLFTGEALGPPELQQSSSCPFPCSSAQPQNSSIRQTWGEHWLPRDSRVWR